MTAVREAFVLPLLFLTVTVASAVEPARNVRLGLPTLFALILATLIIAALVRSNALVPAALLHQNRSTLANVNGAAVLVTLFVASAQLLSRLTPASGLPLLFVDIFLLVLLINTLVASPDRTRLLRSLAVILGAVFVVKFIVLAGLSDAQGSRTARVLIALFDVATFGTVSQEPISSGAGYLAFAAAAMYLVGLALLPHTGHPGQALSRTDGRSLMR